jgi:hypothetical protein
MKIWEWLNGKKTAIGGILATTIAFLNIKGVIDGDTATYLLSLSSLIIGVGVTHKVSKGK